MYVLTRRDLTFAQRAVQSGHAIIEAERAGLIPHEIEHPHLIILEVANEAKLVREVERLTRLGIPVAIWQEPDRNNEITAICSGVVYGDQRRHFSRYTLLKEPCATPSSSEDETCCALSGESNVGSY